MPSENKNFRFRNLVEIRGIVEKATVSEENGKKACVFSIHTERLLRSSSYHCIDLCWFQAKALEGEGIPDLDRIAKGTAVSLKGRQVFCHQQLPDGTKKAGYVIAVSELEILEDASSHFEYLNSISIVGVVQEGCINKINDTRVCRFSVLTETTGHGSEGDGVVRTFFKVTAWDGKRMPALDRITSNAIVSVKGAQRQFRYTTADCQEHVGHEILASEVEILGDKRHGDTITIED